MTGAADFPDCPGPEHDDLRVAVGALALDALEPDETRQVREHMAGCAECDAEYQSFLGVRRIMDTGLADGAFPTGRHRVRVVERRPRNSGLAVLPPRRWIAVVLYGAAAALVIAAAGVTEALIDSQHKASATLVQPAALTGLAPVTSSSGVVAAISYQKVAWGTWVEVTMSNVPPEYSCTLTAYDEAGNELPVASWRSIPGRSTVTAPGAVALDPSQIDHYQIQISGPHGWTITVPNRS
jgi:hypothetical protein